MLIISTSFSKKISLWHENCLYIGETLQEKGGKQCVGLYLPHMGICLKE